MDALWLVGGREGSGLGAKMTGMLEPLATVPRGGRHGLGKDQEILEAKRQRETEEAEVAVKRRKEAEKVAQTFQDRLRSRFSEQKTLGLVRQCRKACEQLDRAAVSQNHLSNFFSQETGVFFFFASLFRESRQVNIGW